MADNGRVRVAHLARSCARFLGRVPLVSRDRMSAGSVDALSHAERAVADLLRQAADVLVDYANGAQGADGKLATGCERFAAESADLQHGLDTDPALGLLRDVFADVATDAAKVGPLGAAPDRPDGPPVPPPRPVRRARAADSSAVPAPGARRRRPAWQPPSEPTT
jgi:hypothetical protein